MLDINYIRENVEKVKEGIKAKNVDPQIIDQILKVDETRRQLIGEIEKFRAERNKLGKEDIEQGKKIKEMLKKLEPDLKSVEEELQKLLFQIPNPPLPDVKIGQGEEDNVEIRKWGEPKKFNFEPKDHLELGNNLDLLDFENGSKVTGSQFYYFCNEAAILEVSLILYAFELLRKEGFTPIITPDLAKSRYYLGTGYAPKGDEAQTYEIKDEDLGLVATAEVTLAGKHADEIISENLLPIKYIGYSHCFRREAGAYGKYSKGLYRVHQFTKAEIFIYCTPEESEKMHQYLLSLEEKIYQGLEIPYRVLEMCSGDLGAIAAKKYDVEAWMPGRNEYGEVTSTSNCTDYQARNLNIRFRRKNNEIDFVHMLNGTAIATSRTMIAILENYQQKDGSVEIPKVLQKYTGFKKISSKK